MAFTKGKKSGKSDKTVNIKGDDELSPSEYAARVKKRNKRVRSTLFTPNDDFKPGHYRLSFRTASDGMIDPQFKFEQLVGRWNNEDVYTMDTSFYDPATAAAFVARASAALFHSNIDKRLPKNEVFRVVVSVRLGKAVIKSLTKPKILKGGKKDTSGDVVKPAIGISFRGMWQRKAAEGGKKPKYIEVRSDSKKVDDVVIDAYKRIKRKAKFLAGAFVDVVEKPGKREYQQMVNAAATGDDE